MFGDNEPVNYYDLIPIPSSELFLLIHLHSWCLAPVSYHTTTGRVAWKGEAEIKAVSALMTASAIGLKDVNNKRKGRRQKVVMPVQGQVIFPIKHN